MPIDTALVGAPHVEYLKKWDLRLELPPGVNLPAPDESAAKREELERIERG